LSDAAALARLVGSDNVITEPDRLLSFSHDHSPHALLAGRRGDAAKTPSCVVRPAVTEEVAALVAWANETKTALVPFGGGSGVCGAIAAGGAVVVDTTRMDGIGGIDEKSLLVDVGAGVFGRTLEESLGGRGYTLGHEPQSMAISTVGGWIATNACGQLSARFGGIEDVVADFEVVLANGSTVRWKSSPRRSTGPDVAALMFGSEGTLGIVTEASLRIARADEMRADRCLRFEHMADGVAACRRLSQSDLGPTLVRLYDREDATIFLRHHPEEGEQPLLLLSFQGRDADARAGEAVELCAGETGTDSLVAYWWEHRNDAVDEYRNILAGRGLLGPHGIVDTMEVAGTWSRLRDLYHSIKDALTPAAGLVACHLSHIYRDGACLYFTIVGAADSEDGSVAMLDVWWEAGMRACLEAGGTISHHHGIGRSRAPWLQEELGPWLDVLRSVKKVIDPNGIMNPGALGL
jgi:alkyldihydroxyacetonephosphate synthase